ncbi:hypothetical protein SAMN05216236_101192 [Sedimentitalea nanhaiensis]|uniref:Uncharacterized protein n=1 Tax=Sedimentitalea nanhaiensis TaxID=999627 RepID=A0A1I6XBY8_9RHOB|nr:hypothetical protein SAMN05216236_101192 [Sedimentitalea nanhaiensis]
MISDRMTSDYSGNNPFERACCMSTTILWLRRSRVYLTENTGLLSPLPCCPTE